MRRQILLAIAVTLCVALWSGTASAELNLWVCFHYAGEVAYEKAEYEDAATVMEAAKLETETPYPPDAVFADGFESGDTSVWDGAVP